MMGAYDNNVMLLITDPVLVCIILLFNMSVLFILSYGIWYLFLDFVGLFKKTPFYKVMNNTFYYIYL